MTAENRPPQEDHPSREEFKRQVEAKRQRRLRSMRHPEQKVWFGLGMFGLVGWSVALPTVAFIALGVWLDNRLRGDASWTLMLLVVGIGLGCLNAWFWVSRERREIERERRNAGMRPGEGEKDDET
ncbi:MAG: AtpZ/AtpI family protein [Syntrophotaleaceae bacterium]